MMNIQISNVNMQYGEVGISGVQVYFSGHDDERMININGYVPLAASEYAGNEKLAALESLVRQKISERLLAEPVVVLDPKAE